MARLVLSCLLLLGSASSFALTGSRWTAKRQALVEQTRQQQRRQQQQQRQQQQRQQRHQQLRTRSPVVLASGPPDDGVLGEELPKELGELAQQGRALAEVLKGVPVFLVCMMGCGKSTLGDLFARSLGSYSFLDTDEVIEKLTGTTIPEIFESEGEEEFRKVRCRIKSGWTTVGNRGERTIIGPIV